MCRSSSYLVMLRWFLAELCPFHFENNMKFSVFVHYLSNSVTHSIKIWHMDMSKGSPGQDWICLWFDDFWQSYAPFTLKIIWNFQFPYIISPTVLHIQLKFYIWICQRNAQVKFEFGHGLMIFWQSYAPFTLKKKSEILSFRSLSPKQLYIFNSNLTYGYVIRIYWSSLNWVIVW
jgi:hypothetical protein